MAGNLRIGWIGIGVMGKNMCQHLLHAGHNVSIYNRTLSKCEQLKQYGANVYETPADIAKNSDIIFTIVGYPKDVRSIYLDPINGILANMKQGGIVVDMTTSEPHLAKEIFEAAKLKQIEAMDAPVSGGDIGAQKGTLSIMIGSEKKETVDQVMPFFQLMGKNIRYMGPPGSGQHTKMVNQILIATNMIGVIEGLLYASKSGLDSTQVLEIIQTGAAGSWSLTNLGPRILQRDFQPGFYVEHFIKDMGIALDEANRMNLSLPGLSLANQFYIALKAQGHGKLGTQALMLVLEQFNGIQSTE